jgi:hypothetical protein
MMKCHVTQGVFFPGCMGAAAAGGCGMTLREQRSYCTCPRKSPSEQKTLEERVAALERKVGKMVRVE